MGGWHAKGNTEFLRAPHAVAVGMNTFRGDLCGTFVFPVIEQAGKQDRDVLNFQLTWESRKLFKVQIGERRNDIKIPTRTLWPMLHQRASSLSLPENPSPV